MDAYNRETTARLAEIMAQDDIADIEKLAQGYGWITGRIIELAEREIELARVMHDQEAVVKHQIKLSTVKLTQGIFESCYIQSTGKRTLVWEVAS